MRVASARISEKGTINGKKGDQTKKELCVSDYKNFGQNKTIRFNSTKKRNAFVKIMKKLVSCEKIGYGQADRLSSYDELKKIGWDISKLDKIKACNTDCSMLVAIAVNCLYKKAKISKYTATSNMLNNFNVAIGSDIKISSLKKDKKVGDIELKAGKHVVVIVEV